MELQHHGRLGSSNTSSGARTRLAGHPIVAYLLVVLLGIAVLAALAIALGWILKTSVLPDHGIGHADEHVNVVLSHHRTPQRNDVSFWISGIGDVYAIPALVAVTAVIAAVKRTWWVAGFILAAIGVEAATYRLTTLVIHRERPNVPRLASTAAKLRLNARSSSILVLPGSSEAVSAGDCASPCRFPPVLQDVGRLPAQPLPNQEPPCAKHEGRGTEG